MKCKVEISMITRRIVWQVLILVLLGTPTFAFKVKPEATTSDNRIRSLQQSPLVHFSDGVARLVINRFTSGVHERITNQIYGCEGNADECESPDGDRTSASKAVIGGVRWNDNPPFKLQQTRLKMCPKGTIKLPNFSVCWYELFRDAKKRAANGVFFDVSTGTVPIYRVHFGDMQFLHSMASKDGEPASYTINRMMMWAELTYKVALGEISSQTEVRKSGISGTESLFKTRGWNIQQLFTRGDPTFRKERDLKDFAFGSLLHVVEDSFSIAHTERERGNKDDSSCPHLPQYKQPGKILSFHAYGHQDEGLHGEQDSHGALDEELRVDNPTVVDVGKVILSYYREKKPWPKLKEYLECVFTLADPNAPAGPGDMFLPPTPVPEEPVPRAMISE